MSALIDIKQECAGKVAPILKSLGYEESIFSGKHQPCPFCGGKDRARWVKAKEYLHCNQCGPVGFMDMAISITGENYGRTAKIIRGEDLNRMEPIKVQDDSAKNQARIAKILEGKQPLKGSQAEHYLIARGLSVLPEREVYFHPGVDYWQDQNKRVLPAMISVFRDAENKGATLHITYLEYDSKADVQSPKKFLPVAREMKGGAIRLFNPDNGVLAVAEGIETALAVHQLEGLPVWASGNAGQMASMVIPSDIKELWIYADADFAGMEAALALAKRYKHLDVGIVYPDEFSGGHSWRPHKRDFLDELNLEQSARSAQ